MQPRLPPDHDAPAPAERTAARVQTCDDTVLDDLRFLAAWDLGLLPPLSSILRVRQLRRANPPGGRTGDVPTAPNPAGRATWQS